MAFICVYDNAPKAFDSCSTYDKKKNGEERAHTLYFLKANVVSSFGQIFDNPPMWSLDA